MTKTIKAVEEEEKEEAEVAMDGMINIRVCMRLCPMRTCNHCNATMIPDNDIYVNNYDDAMMTSPSSLGGMSSRMK